MISAQRLRCEYFKSVTPNITTKSVWNKTIHEKGILEQMINLYKDFYLQKIVEIEKQLEETKEYNINSILTYDADYYVNQFNDKMEDIKKYRVMLDKKTDDEIYTEDLTFISEDINFTFSDYIPDPILRTYNIVEEVVEEVVEKEVEEVVEEVVEKEVKSDKKTD